MNYFTLHVNVSIIINRGFTASLSALDSRNKSATLDINEGYHGDCKTLLGERS